MAIFGGWFGGEKKSDDKPFKPKVPGAYAAPVGSDPRTHLDSPEIQKPKFSNLPNTIANILEKDQIDRSDLQKGVMKFINRHGFKTMQGYGFESEDGRLPDETLRNIVDIILAFYIEEKNEFVTKGEDGMEARLHLKEGRARDLLLAALFILSQNREMFKAFADKNIKKISALFPDFFSTESAM
jgi:hypothetical protein